MKKIALLALLLPVALLGPAQLNPVITSWIQNPDTSLPANRTSVPVSPGSGTYYTIPSNVLKVQYDTANVYISCFCIPGYSIGPWSHNPNVPTNQNFVYKLTLHPAPNTGSPVTIPNGHIGVWRNGVSIFNADDAQYVDTVWSRNAYYFEGNSFDNCLGHPDQTGEYHHHVSPPCLYNSADSTHHSPIIGYALDGYPIYGAYGYADTNGTGPIQRMRSSYQIRTDTSRTTQPDGTPASVHGPSCTQGYTVMGPGGVHMTQYYPMGSLLWDYVYTPGSGDLDQHNGRWCKTPEYPNGTYAYFVTITDSAQFPQFPYTPYLTYYGVVQSGNIGPGGGHNTIHDSTTVYTDTTVSTEVNALEQGISFRIVPNPTEGYIYVYMGDNSLNNVSVSLCDEKGAQLENLGLMQPTIAYAVNLTHYPAGVYLLRMSAAGRTVVKRVVKE